MAISSNSSPSEGASPETESLRQELEWLRHCHRDLLLEKDRLSLQIAQMRAAGTAAAPSSSSMPARPGRWRWQSSGLRKFVRWLGRLRAVKTVAAALPKGKRKRPAA